jgi:hypothetical protein
MKLSTSSKTLLKSNKMILICKILLALLLGSCTYEYIIVEKLRQSISVAEYTKYLKKAEKGMIVIIIIVIITSIVLICTR